MIDWHSWHTRLTGASLDLDLDDELIAQLLCVGLVKRRLGRLCLTQVGSQMLREAYEAQVNRAFEERDRYRTTLAQIAEVYNGERDYPGRLARRALQS
jgi:hypothetical protein